MTAIFLLSWFGQSVNGWRALNNAQDEHKSAHISYGEYLVNADFWDRTLQNWQSEFLAVGSMAVFTVYLRQRGSPESKPGRHTTKPRARASPVRLRAAVTTGFTSWPASPARPAYRGRARRRPDPLPALASPTGRHSWPRP